jgi:hypothetical protein
VQMHKHAAVVLRKCAYHFPGRVLTVDAQLIRFETQAQLMNRRVSSEP